MSSSAAFRSTNGAKSKTSSAFLRMVQSGNDYVSFAATINLPKRGIGETSIEKIRVAASHASAIAFTVVQRCPGRKQLPPGFKLTAGQRKGLETYVCIINELKEIASSCSLQELVNETIHRTGYLGHLRTGKRYLPGTARKPKRPCQQSARMGTVNGKSLPPRVPGGTCP